MPKTNNQVYLKYQRNVSRSLLWRSLLSGWIKLNADTNFQESKHIGVSWVIAKYEKGLALSGLTEKHGAFNSFVAFGSSRCHCFASSLGLDRIDLESDNLVLIQTCRGEITRHEIGPFVQDIW